MDVTNRISSDLSKNMEIKNTIKRVDSPIVVSNKDKQANGNLQEKDSKINIVIQEDNTKVNKELVGVNTAEGSYINTKIAEAIEEIKDKSNYTTTLEYEIHDETQRVHTTVINSKTGEVIREVPSEQQLDFIAKIKEEYSK